MSRRTFWKLTPSKLTSKLTALLLLSLSPVAGLGCKKTAAPAAPTATAPGEPVAAPSAGVGAFGKGTIVGSVRFTGKPPEVHTLSTPDPFCARQPIKEEEVMVGAAGGLKNVIVRVVKGTTGTYEPPATTATVDQSGCMYRPRAQVVMAGQAIQIRNSDQTLHNVHSYRGASTMFNQAQIPGMAPLTKTLSDGGQVIKFKCDVHPWMTGYVAVATNPFFAVSADDGSFTIDRLPPGTYTLEAWHERLGTRSLEVKVADDQPTKAQFEFAAP
jgi:plastocyanin